MSPAPTSTGSFDGGLMGLVTVVALVWCVDELPWITVGRIQYPRPAHATTPTTAMDLHPSLKYSNGKRKCSTRLGREVFQIVD